MIQESKHEPKFTGWDVVSLVIFVPLVYVAGVFGFGWWIKWVNESDISTDRSSHLYKILFYPIGFCFNNMGLSFLIGLGINILLIICMVRCRRISFRNKVYLTAFLLTLSASLASLMFIVYVIGESMH